MKIFLGLFVSLSIIALVIAIVIGIFILKEFLYTKTSNTIVVNIIPALLNTI